MLIQQGPHFIDDTLTFSVTTHRFDTGALTDADGVPTYRVYEDETGTAILTGSMAKLDDANTTGFYSEQLTLSAANGFEAGKSYNVYVSAAVNSVTGASAGGFKVNAALPANVTQISGDSTAADNLEAAADGSGYNLGGGSVVAASVTGSIGGSLLGDVGGDLTGNVNGSVASIASGGITAASFAANAIDASKLDPDVTTELQTGLATAASVSALDGKIDTIDNNVDAILVDTAEIGAAGAGLTNINLPNQTMDIVGNITGNLSGSVGSVTGLTASDVGAIKAKTDNLPTDPADQSLVIAATNTILSDTNAIKVTTDKVDDTLEDDAGTYRFTTNALEQAPAGGGGGDATEAKQDTIIGLIGTPAVTLADDIAGISAGSGLDAAGVRAAIGLASANLDTQLADLPTNAELATSQASADDATLAELALIKAKTDNLPSDPADQSLIIAATTAIIADTEDIQASLALRLDAAVSTRATPAQVATELGTYDAPTKAELDAAVALLATAANLAAAKIVVDAIKLKTDLIPSDPAETSDIPSAATVAAAVLAAAASDPIDANVQEINDTALTGDGNSTPWGPAA